MNKLLNRILCKLGLHIWTGDSTKFGKMGMSGYSECRRKRCKVARQWFANGWVTVEKMRHRPL